MNLLFFLNKCGELKSVLSGLIVSLRFYFSYWLSCGSLLLCVTGVWQRLLGLTEYFNLWWLWRHCGPGRIKGSHSSLSSEQGSIYTNFYSYSSTSSAIPTTCHHPAWAELWGLPIKERWVTGQDVKLGVVSMGHQSLNRWKYTSIMDNLCQTSYNSNTGKEAFGGKKVLQWCFKFWQANTASISITTAVHPFIRCLQYLFICRAAKVSRELETMPQCSQDLITTVSINPADFCCGTTTELTLLSISLCFWCLFLSQMTQASINQIVWEVFYLFLIYHP